ncbi:MAG: FtsX-like permease family protein [Pirellulales bacterium]
MYKLLLCWRYLCTRYIAMVSIISVTLGVATLIVVNSVMSGFTHEMEDRMHGIISDVVVESRGMIGFVNADAHMARIREIVGDDIDAMTPTVHVPAMLNFRVNGSWMMRQVNFIGIDPKSYHLVSDSSGYLQHPQNRQQLSFNLRDGGYDIRDYTGGTDAPTRFGMEWAGWPYRRKVAEQEKAWLEMQQASMNAQVAAAVAEARRADPFAGIETPKLAAAGDEGVDQQWEPISGQGRDFDRATEQYTGIVLGIALSRFRTDDGDHFLTLPGDDVTLTFPTTDTPPQAVNATFTIVDFYESKMSEYDSAFVFAPLDEIQRLRNMVDPTTGATSVTAIQIKLKEGVSLNAVRDTLRRTFPPEYYAISTWRDKQGPLLAAVQMETVILNILLFLIIAVAGFGILAIFFMIVVEKTKDIGVLKSLGASGSGIMSIFLSYGLSLGVVGSGVGLALGLLFVHNIDRVRHAIEHVTGQQVFDPDIYYFQEIPTIVEPLTIAWIISGAIGIAVLFSILPALRAARLHPVEALRYE